MKKTFSMIIGSFLIALNFYASDPSLVPDQHFDEDQIDAILYVFPEDVSDGKPIQSEKEDIHLMALDRETINNITQNLHTFSNEPDIDGASYNLPESGVSGNQPNQPDIYGRYPTSTNMKQYQLGTHKLVQGKEQAILKMPVLDQAKTSTCVTFSSTAAMDILLADGTDKYSIYKSLCLGWDLFMLRTSIPPEINTSLRDTNRYFFPNPWNGSWAYIVMSQFKKFGLVEMKDVNSDNGKFGTTEIKQPHFPSNLKEFKQFPNLNYSLLYHANVPSTHKYGKTADFINAVKNEINKGNIVSISIMIAPGYPGGNNGMTAHTKINKDQRAVIDMSKQSNPAKYNTWYKDSNLINFIENNAGNERLLGAHAMIVIGYVDMPGNKNEGLLIVRNSWGSNAGDKGNNYISYDYAFLLCTEAVVISVR